MEEINVKLECQEFIPLVNLLKMTNAISSGGQIKMLLAEELIQYNDTIAFQKKKKCFAGDVIIVNNEVKITVE